MTVSSEERDFIGEVIREDEARRNPKIEPETVPPASGDVEVLAWHYEGLAYTAQPHSRAIELVDRAHVTRLQAENDDALFKLAEQIVAAEKERDALKAEVELLTVQAGNDTEANAAIRFERDHYKSELTKAWELIELAVKYLSSGAVKTTLIQYLNAMLAHQSAPAEPSCEFCGEYAGKPCNMNYPHPKSAPAAKEGE